MAHGNYLYLNGIPSSAGGRGGEPFFAFDPQGIWRFSKDDGWYAVEDACLALHDAFKKAIMRGVPYDELLVVMPQFVSMAGHNSEAPISAALFQEMLQLSGQSLEINRFLYLYDCQRLVSSIQECTKEIIQVQGEFYRTLNAEPFFYPPLKQPDGVRYSASPTTTKLFAFLSFIFIRMHSLLDYTVKVATEAENLKTNFTIYPKAASLNAQYGDRKHVGFNGAQGTLFEDCAFLTGVETLRNHVIHNGLLDDMPKGYEVIENGSVIERYILFPDMTDGRFDRFKNRNLFFGGEDKINLRLPALVAEFMARQESTLKLVVQGLEAVPGAE